MDGRARLAEAGDPYPLAHLSIVTISRLQIEALTEVEVETNLTGIRLGRQVGRSQVPNEEPACTR